MLLSVLFCVLSSQAPQVEPMAWLASRVQDRSEPAQLFVARASERGRLGVTLGAASHGVGVQTVEPGSAAERAELRVGDRIVVVDGRQTLTADAVVAAVRAKRPGDELRVIVERDFDIEVRELPSQDGSSRPRLGVTLDGAANELRVATVEDGAPALTAGVRAGDRLLSLDGMPTPNLDALRAKLETLTLGSKAKLTIARELSARLDAAPDAPANTTPGAPPSVFDVVPLPRNRTETPTPPAAPRFRVVPEDGGRQAARRRARDRANAPENLPDRAPPHAEVDTRELTEAMHALRAELAELRRELGELRRELGDRRPGGRGR
ncbi:MAG: PDZ domain-containing protein [Planctomycetes bacterium]|nr:PDZ domain-containing protein [Planctomycetota bacterium]